MDLPIGTIVMFDGANLPAGWFDCDGAEHNGATTPNLIDAFPRGVLASGGSLGASSGSATHSHTNVNAGNAVHGHASASGNTGGASSLIGNLWSGNDHPVVAGHFHLITAAALSDQENHAHTVPNTNAASSLPPNIRLRYIMRCE